MKKLELGVRAVLALIALSSGLMDFAAPDALLQSFGNLRLPTYYLPFFGVLKVLGMLGLFSEPVVKTDVLRQGAQWGLLFYFVGASVTHVLANDAAHAGAPVVLALLALTSLVLYVRGKALPGHTTAAAPRNLAVA
ncbi:MAG: DoxX family protein [Myxococcota bacterium]